MEDETKAAIYYAMQVTARQRIQNFIGGDNRYLEWLPKRDPVTARKILDEMPEVIESAATARMPLPAFQSLLDCWVCDHKHLFELWKMHQAGQAVPVDPPLPVGGRFVS